MEILNDEEKFDVKFNNNFNNKFNYNNNKNIEKKINNTISLILSNINKKSKLNENNNNKYFYIKEYLILSDLINEYINNENIIIYIIKLISNLNINNDLFSDFYNEIINSINVEKLEKKYLKFILFGLQEKINNNNIKNIDNIFLNIINTCNVNKNIQTFEMLNDFCVNNINNKNDEIILLGIQCYFNLINFIKFN